MFLEPLGALTCKNKKFFLAGNIKLRPIVKLCIIFKDVLAKKLTIILINKEKRHFGPILGHFEPIIQPKQFLKKKSFKGTLMAISMLLRDNLWKMPQQIGVNLEKQAILG